MSWKTFNGKKVERSFRSACSEALMNAVEATGMASDQQVPHDEGTLQGTKTIMRDPDDELNISIGYGGGGASGFPIVPYAIKWHEVPANFQKGRKHNYLRDPVKTVLLRVLKGNLKRLGLK